MFARLLMLIGLLFVSGHASAQLEVCNKSMEKVSVALLSAQTGDWRSTGWYNIAAGDCGHLIVEPLNNHNYYIYAKGYRADSNIVWSGDHYNCVINVNAFDLLDTGSCSSKGAITEGFKKVETGEAREFTYTLVDTNNPYREVVKTGVIQERCLIRYDDSHQVHSVETILRWNYQAVKTRMKRLEHCIKIRVVGPIEVENIAKAYVDKCVNYGLNHQKTRHALELVVAVAGHIASAGATGGGLTAAKITNYVTSAMSETLDCLTDTGKITDFIGKQIQDKFDATVKHESHWVYWNL